MGYKFRVIMLLFLFLTEFLFSQLSIEIIEPQNGAYINYTPVTFSFIVKNTTPLNENIDFDPTNISCFIQFFVDGKIIKKGPLNLPVDKIGSFEFITLPYKEYIWSINCLSFSSTPMILIVKNQSYEDFLKDMYRDDNKNINLNDTTNATKNFDSASYNQSLEMKQTKKEELEENNKKKDEMILFFVAAMFFIVFIYLFVKNQKNKKDETQNEKIEVNENKKNVTKNKNNKLIKDTTKREVN